MQNHSETKPSKTAYWILNQAKIYTHFTKILNTHGHLSRILHSKLHLPKTITWNVYSYIEHTHTSDVECSWRPSDRTCAIYTRRLTHLRRLESWSKISALSPSSSPFSSFWQHPWRERCYHNWSCHCHHCCCSNCVLLYLGISLWCLLACCSLHDLLA